MGDNRVGERARERDREREGERARAREREKKREEERKKKRKIESKVNDEVDVFYLCKLARRRKETGHYSKTEKGVCIPWWGKS